MGVHVEFNPAPQLAHADPRRGRRGVAARAGRPRGHAVRARGGAADPRRARRARAADRLRRRAVHDGHLPRRGRRHRSRSPPSRACCSATPRTAHRLLAICADTVASYLAEQVKAGAQAAMLFDTWAGLLGPEDVRTFALPYARRVLEAVREAARRIGARVPLIYYAGDAAGWLEACARHRAPTSSASTGAWGSMRARARVGTGVALQGNLDPTILLGPRALIRQRTRGVLLAARGLSGGDAEAAPAPAPRPHLQPRSRHPAADAARSRAAARRQRARGPGDPIMSDAPLPLYRRSPAPRRRDVCVPIGAARSAAPVRPAGAALHVVSHGRGVPRRLRRARVPRAAGRCRADRPTTRSRSTCTCRSARALLVLRMHGHHHEEARGRGAVPRVTSSARSRCSPTALGGRRRVVQYHWGGGTPTYLTLAEMDALHATVARHFDVQPGAEVAIEVDPRVTTTEQLTLLRQLGFNRLSFGVQDFTPEVQEAVNRVQSGRPDAPALRRRAAARVRVDQHRPDLRAAAADARVVRPRGRHRRGDAPRSRGRVLVRARALDPRQPEAHRPGDAADGRAQAGAVRRRDGAVPGRRLRADRHGPLRAAGRRAGARRRPRGGCTATSWATRRKPAHRHGRPRRVGDRRRGRRVRAEHEEALHLLRAISTPAGFPSSAATCSTPTTGCGGSSSPS